MPDRIPTPDDLLRAIEALKKTTTPKPLPPSEALQGPPRPTAPDPTDVPTVGPRTKIAARAEMDPPGPPIGWQGPNRHWTDSGVVNRAISAIYSTRTLDDLRGLERLFADPNSPTGMTMANLPGAPTQVRTGKGSRPFRRREVKQWEPFEWEEAGHFEDPASLIAWALREQDVRLHDLMRSAGQASDVAIQERTGAGPGRADWSINDYLPPEMQADDVDLTRRGETPPPKSVGSVLGEPSPLPRPVGEPESGPISPPEPFLNVPGLSQSIPWSDPRIQRALRNKYAQPGFHGTFADFEEFITADLGVHIGPATAANDRLRQMMDDGRMILGPDSRMNIIPVLAQAERPLRTKDLGNWDDPVRLGDILRDETDLPSRAKFEIAQIVEDSRNDFFYFDALSDEDRIDLYGTQDWRKTPQAQSAVADIVYQLEIAGYDSIIYKNDVEGPGQDSLIVFNPEQLRSINAEFGDSTSKNLLKTIGGFTVAGSLLAPTDESTAEAGIVDPALMAQRTRTLGTRLQALQEERLARDPRATIQRGRLTTIEQDAIRLSAHENEIGEREALAAARAWKRRHPGRTWEQPVITGVSRDNKGNIDVTTTKLKYNYHLDPRTGLEARRGGAYHRRLVDSAYAEMLELKRLADEGDPAARRVFENTGWYRNVQERLGAEWGSFQGILTDLIGATSPKTPVETNWRWAQDILRRAQAGEFDAAMNRWADMLDEADRFENLADTYMEEQRASGVLKKNVLLDPVYREHIGNAKLLRNTARNEGTIRQSDGIKKYGINSGNAMVALADRWRVLRRGQAPKARNFSGNLDGWSPHATIDVWAARYLRRHSGRKPLPPSAEQGVKGNLVDPVTMESDKEFGFGQDVMRELADRLNRETGADLEPRDLQAMAWFAEKNIWTRRNWTSRAGEGGSIDTLMEAGPVESLVVGTSRARSTENQLDEFIPNDEDQAFVADRLMRVTMADPDVKAGKAMTTQGMFGGDPEISFDIDIVSERDRIPADSLDLLAEQAVADQQHSFFVARRIDPELGRKAPGLFNAGAEMRFNNPVDFDDPVLQQIQADLADNDVFGFTLIVDPREPGRRAIGLRVLDIPQYYGDEGLMGMLNLTPREYGKHVTSMNEHFASMGDMLRAKYGEVIRDTRTGHYDVNVLLDSMSRGYLDMKANPQLDTEELQLTRWGWRPAHERMQEYAFYDGVGMPQRVAEAGGVPPDGDDAKSALMIGPAIGGAAVGGDAGADFRSRRRRSWTENVAESLRRNAEDMAMIGRTATGLGTFMMGESIADTAHLTNLFNPFVFAATGQLPDIKQTRRARRATSDMATQLSALAIGDDMRGLDAVSDMLDQALKDFAPAVRLLEPLVAPLAPSEATKRLARDVWRRLPERAQEFGRVVSGTATTE